MVSAAKSLAEGTHHIKASDLDTSALASLNQAKGLREEAAIAQSKVKTLSERHLARSQSKGITISKELTQEVLEFIAHQPANSINGTSGSQIDGHRL